MKCPNCGLIEKDEAFGQPPQCPSCGVFYDKALKVAELKEKLRQENAAKEQELAAVSVFKQRIANAAEGVAEVRAERARAEDKDNANEVVITGVIIPFWPLVILLVRLALASIPATIILVILLFGLISILDILFLL